MAAVPDCARLGRHCRELPLTLFIADTTDPAALRDGLGTWLLGHTERIRFGAPYRRGGKILVDAIVQVPCKHLDAPADGRGARCAVHGFTGRLPAPAAFGGDATRRHAADRFTVVDRDRIRTMVLPPAHRRALPTLQANPCAGARCRTADNARGAACCRDLTLDVMLPADRTHEEALLRSRRSPYLCKVERVDEHALECEVISRCDYLDPADQVSCTLHGRRRPDGSDAKPPPCVEWPDPDVPGFVGHPGCVFLEPRA